MTAQIAGVGPHSRRLRRIQIEATFVFDILRSQNGTRAFWLQQEIPEDARCLFTSLDHERNVLTLYVESAEFDEVPMYAQPPDWRISVGYWQLSDAELQEQGRVSSYMPIHRKKVESDA